MACVCYYRCTACAECFFTNAEFIAHAQRIHCKVLVCQGQDPSDTTMSPIIDISGDVPEGQQCHDLEDFIGKQQEGRSDLDDFMTKSHQGNERGDLDDLLAKPQHGQQCHDLSDFISKSQQGHEDADTCSLQVYNPGVCTRREGLIGGQHFREPAQQDGSNACCSETVESSSKISAAEALLKYEDHDMQPDMASGEASYMSHAPPCGGLVVKTEAGEVAGHAAGGSTVCFEETDFLQPFRMRHTELAYSSTDRVPQRVSSGPALRRRPETSGRGLGHFRQAVGEANSVSNNMAGVSGGGWGLDDRGARLLRNHIYTCPVCAIQCHLKTDLNKHIRENHKKYKPIKCDVCHAAFQFRKNMTEHMKTHTGVRPFKCYLCKKEFRRRYHLKRHVVTCVTPPSAVIM
ncbi:PREDICTED: zinc finger protein 205-like isoform X4 [Priapulus caudatus]|uniref:Zinc finger protein 205-like isoform X4 n=1 Tax=Priapulus caudatus TaxID=37621 RepID=A0ABM1E890_PRICU|nr:PREDICTED: zinc finger protein 205-like isoform X4 [Priapulus caudatus]